MGSGILWTPQDSLKVETKFGSMGDSFVKMLALGNQADLNKLHGAYYTSAAKEKEAEAALKQDQLSALGQLQGLDPSDPRYALLAAQGKLGNLDVTANGAGTLQANKIFFDPSSSGMDRIRAGESQGKDFSKAEAGAALGGFAPTPTGNRNDNTMWNLSNVLHNMNKDSATSPQMASQIRRDETARAYGVEGIRKSSHLEGIDKEVSGRKDVEGMKERNKPMQYFDKETGTYKQTTSGAFLDNNDVAGGKPLTFIGNHDYGADQRVKQDNEAYKGVQKLVSKSYEELQAKNAGKTNQMIVAKILQNPDFIAGNMAVIPRLASEVGRQFNWTEGEIETASKSKQALEVGMIGASRKNYGKDVSDADMRLLLRGLGGGDADPNTSKLVNDVMRLDTELATDRHNALAKWGEDFRSINGFEQWYGPREDVKRQELLGKLSEIHKVLGGGGGNAVSGGGGAQEGVWNTILKYGSQMNPLGR